MDATTTNVFKAIADLTRLSTEVMPLAAIWLDKPLQTARKRTIRITKGDMVRVNKGYLPGDLLKYDYCLGDVKENAAATHVILECKGTIYSGNLQVICEDLDTQEIITVKL